MRSLIRLAILMFLACCVLAGHKKEHGRNGVFHPDNPNSRRVQKALKHGVMLLDCEDHSYFWRKVVQTFVVKSKHKDRYRLYHFKGVELAMTDCSKKIPFFETDLDRCRVREGHKQPIRICDFYLLEKDHRNYKLFPDWKCKFRN